MTPDARAQLLRRACCSPVFTAADALIAAFAAQDAYEAERASKYRLLLSAAIRHATPPPTGAAAGESIRHF